MNSRKAPAFIVLLSSTLFASGCLVFQDEPHLPPGQHRWNVSPIGYKAAKSTWTGTLDSREVFDLQGTATPVVVLVHVNGLNPADVVSREGTVLERRPMPDAFYLWGEDGYLVRDEKLVGQKVRVHGVLHTTNAGGAVSMNGRSSPVFADDPTTRRSSVALQMQVWPVIRVTNLEPLK